VGDSIPGGTFQLPYDDGSGQLSYVERQVNAFTLDRFEVTVSRFYPFLLEFDAARSPVDGAGAYPDAPESGWRIEWSDDPRLVAPTAQSLSIGISACGPWAHEELTEVPMRCVNWYIAQAFCIWDGGRLPTESEWAFSAMGGDEQRVYPWSTSTDDQIIDQSLACYRDRETTWSGPQAVGSHPEGAGRWGTRDLAGNVFEWVADVYRDSLDMDGCLEPVSETASSCAEPSTDVRRTTRGGSYANNAALLTNETRLWTYASMRDPLVGFRCARDP
jgi:formylglycine-generating enzyme required for sulfatase activity